jgi:hypothetical protein
MMRVGIGGGIGSEQRGHVAMPVHPACGAVRGHQPRDGGEGREPDEQSESSSREWMPPGPRRHQGSFAPNTVIRFIVVSDWPLMYFYERDL